MTFEKLVSRRNRLEGIRLGRLVVKLCTNGAGAPLVDDAWTRGVRDDGGEWESGGKAISLVRARNKYGERLPGRAVYVGIVR